MKVNDTTSSAWYSFTNSDAQGRFFDILVVKESYTISDAGALGRRPEPELITFADAYFGDPVKTSIWMASDVVPYKPHADVLVAANTYVPGGSAAESWPFGLSIGAHGVSHDLRLKAHGRRAWSRVLGSWQLEDTEPVSIVPVRWENAYGGAIRVPQEAELDRIEVLQTNPIGRGWVDPRLARNPGRISAPQIVWEGDAPGSPQDVLTPAGLGPIPPAWLPRRPLGGTYDADWEANIAPNWAPDYDFAFHNAAPPSAQLPGFLSGSETVRCLNLRPDLPELHLQLPGTGLMADVTYATGATRRSRLAADTLYLDLLPDWLGACLVSVTWRLVLPREAVDGITLTRVATDSADWAEAAHAPHPHDVTNSQKEAA